MSLFQVRDDVYAQRWESADGIKSAYYRAYIDREKTSYKPLTQYLIEDHLRGNRTIGIYAILPDNNVYFVTADFDGEGWQDDLIALVDECNKYELPSYVERSRSGNGGHVWLFLEDCFPAHKARTVFLRIIKDAGLIDTFDKIQKLLDNNPKKINFHNHRDEKKNYYFPGLAQCGECGYAVTTEWHKKKSGKVFKDYRCTKKSKTHKCEQKPIKEKDLSSQVERFISQVRLPDDIYEAFQEQVNIWEQEEMLKSKALVDNLDNEINETKEMIERLLDLRLSGDISSEEFRIKKNSLVNKKANLEAKKSKIIKEGNVCIEPLRNFIKTAKQAESSYQKKNYQEMNRILKKIGLNSTLIDKKLSMTFLESFNFLVQMHTITENGSIPDEKVNKKNCKNKLESSVYSDEDVSKTSHYCYTACSETFMSSCSPRLSVAKPRALTAFAKGGVSGA